MAWSPADITEERRFPIGDSQFELVAPPGTNPDEVISFADRFIDDPRKAQPTKLQRFAQGAQQLGGVLGPILNTPQAPSVQSGIPSFTGGPGMTPEVQAQMTENFVQDASQQNQARQQTYQQQMASKIQLREQTARSIEEEKDRAQELKLEGIRKKNEELRMKLDATLKEGAAGADFGRGEATADSALERQKVLNRQESRLGTSGRVKEIGARGEALKGLSGLEHIQKLIELQVSGGINKGNAEGLARLTHIQTLIQEGAKAYLKKRYGATTPLVEPTDLTDLALKLAAQHFEQTQELEDPGMYLGAAEMMLTRAAAGTAAQDYRAAGGTALGEGLPPIGATRTKGGVTYTHIGGNKWQGPTE